MTNFEKITASPDVLGEFLATLPVAAGPWDEEFHRMFCDSCELLECRPETCPHKGNRLLWWLTMGDKTGGGENRVVMWVKKDSYRKTMEEFAGKIKEARSERIQATGDKSFTHLAALLTELVEVLLPDEIGGRYFFQTAYTRYSGGTPSAWKPLRFQNGRLQQG